MSLDKDASTATLKCTYRQWWNDTRLTWDPKEYGGQDKVFIDVSGPDPAIWVPVTVIREDAGSSFFSDFKETQIRINYDGSHYWSRPG